MSKQHEALNLFYPGLFDIEHLDLMLFLNLPLEVKKSLLSIDWLYQRFKLAYKAFGQLELVDIEDLPLWDDKEFVCHYLEYEFSSWTLEKVYQLLSNELIIDRDINLLLAHSPTMFNCIYNPFKQDREFIKSMLQNNGENLCCPLMHASLVFYVYCLRHKGNPMGCFPRRSFYPRLREQSYPQRMHTHFPLDFLLT